MSRIIKQSGPPKPNVLECHECGTVFEPAPEEITIRYAAWTGHPYWGVDCPVCRYSRYAEPGPSDPSYPSYPKANPWGTVVGLTLIFLTVVLLGYLLYTVLGGAPL